MAELTIYGVPASRAARVLWLANELDLDYEHVPTAGAEARTPDYLAINPNGLIPAIRDGDYTLWESMAINLYLVQKHGGDLAPASTEEAGRAYQWSFWVMTEVEGRLLTALMHRLLLPEAERDAAEADKALTALGKPLGVLDQALAGREWLIADRFTVADLNVAAVLAWARILRVDLADVPQVAAWLERCLSRPAYQRVRG